jgi:hypothetical protein
VNEELNIKAADILPVLDNIIGFVTEALTAYDAVQVKNAQLEKQLADKDKILLEKVAATPAPLKFNEEDVQQTLASLQSMNIIDQALATKLAADISKDPHAVLPLLTKISAALITTGTSEGEGIEKEAGVLSEDEIDPEDPDGWKAFREGRQVKLRR